MVAAISRLASLLKQATAGDVPLPTVKPDPAKTALIKTLVMPRAPLGAEPMPSLAPPLVVPSRVVMAQKEASPQVIKAYRAALELEEPVPINPRPSTARETGTEAEARPQSGLLAGRDDAGIRNQPLPAYALALPLSTRVRQIQEEEATGGKRRSMQAKASHRTLGDAPPEAAIGARMIAFGLAALALLLLIVLLVF
ncbi:MAG TPA: hypothetical protein VGV39_14425 [Mesorhizobium sp.]|jgi:hypothetical protein|uniref:hypothetical protein n=1 Tax=Mesorhizobium sp. TaxID=1871066 RepID=UPI002DDCFB9F|nr:hypothetical protein [Mesorhizobium sp.]HEV2504270.1 hypothetical protein [Mesorhizobium sp.]